jgi:hypothetical protein
MLSEVTVTERTSLARQRRQRDRGLGPKPPLRSRPPAPPKFGQPASQHLDGFEPQVHLNCVTNILPRPCAHISPAREPLRQDRLDLSSLPDALSPNAPACVTNPSPHQNRTTNLPPPKTPKATTRASRASAKSSESLSAPLSLSGTAFTNTRLARVPQLREVQARTGS